MKVIRRRLSCVAVLGLLFQITAIAVSPLALCCEPIKPVEQTAADEDECCKGLAEGQMCPMHHHVKPKSAPASSHHQHHATPKSKDSAGCVMTNACKAPVAGLLSLLGSGPLPSITTVTIAAVASSPVRAGEPVPLTRDPLPDTPPPRA